MKIKFSIHYKAQWGQSLCLLVHSTDNKDKNDPETYPMQCTGQSSWNVEIANNHTQKIDYQYIIKTPRKPDFYEYGGIRHFVLPENFSSINIIDNWRAPFGDSPFNSSVFKDCFFKREYTDERIKDNKNNLLIRLNCPQVEPDRYFAIIGNQKHLGNWDVSKKVKLNSYEYPTWEISLATKKIQFPLEFKFLMVDSTTDEVIAWGGGANRKINTLEHNDYSIINEEHFIRTTSSWKGTGVAIPVFSLRSKKSFGTGEFNDLKLMIDWAKKTGQKIIQTLPVNDTTLYHTNYDSYPYNAVSVHALHPIYLNLDKIGKLKDVEKRNSFAEKKKELNDKTFSDYQNVMTAKWEFYKEIYPQEQKKIFASQEYKTFFEGNKDWLVPYAAFSYLRDFYGTPEFSNWEKYSKFDRADIDEFTKPGSNFYHDIAIYYFLQFHLHKQLTEVHDYALQNGIVIKGDLPIGVSPRSVDAWVHPDLFNTQVQAGAPPDDFSATGQNWGFPTYNWELMEKDGYLWWKKRFQKLSEYFDAYRIDHILGFFRIWEIPVNDVWGLTGSFHPALPFTVSELKSRGLWWDEDRYLKPYMKEHVLYAIFGKYTDDVIREYLLPDGWQNYKFKPEFDTQKKIEAHFATLGYNFGNKEIIIRDGLYTLHCEVLFVPDLREPGKFHPRISMHSSASFRDLNDNTRRILDQIYVDYFYHRHNEFWKMQAMKKLPALISATDMLVCGEDLGMVPDSVPEVMNNLEILSLEIQRMPKRPNTEFAMPANAPYLSVCTTSTHDMNPIRAWWEEDKNITQRFYNHALGLQGPAPEKCEQWIAEKIIEQHLQSRAMWIILPWQDWMSVESKLCLEHPFAERINVPSNPRNFWCYRMHISLEKLLKENKLNNKIAGMIKESGR